MAERTKIWIADTMKELMKHKTIDKIRITGICRAAGIERSTFYYHFQDKYELVAWIFFQNAYKTDVISVEDAARSMETMKQDFLFYKRAYEDSSQNALWTYMLEYFAGRYERAAKEKLNTDVLDEQIRFSIRFYCFGCIGMTREWLLYDNTTSAKTAVEMMFASMPEMMRTIYFGAEQTS